MTGRTATDDGASPDPEPLFREVDRDRQRLCGPLAERPALAPALTAIWIGAIGGVLAFVPVLLSPVRSLRRIEDAQPES